MRFFEQLPFFAHCPVRRATIFAAMALFASAPLAAQEAAPPAPPGDDQPSLMKFLAEHGKHDMENERWNAYMQFTYIYGWKQALSAPYTDLNGSNGSLLPTPEQSFTGTGDAVSGSAAMERAARLTLCPS